MSRFLRFTSEGEENNSPKPTPKQLFQSPPHKTEEEESIFSRPLFMQGRTPGNISTPPKSSTRGFSSPDGQHMHMAKFSGVERSHRRQQLSSDINLVKEFDELNYETFAA
jgi:hypothetical protein